MVRGVVTLPNGSGRTLRVGVFARGAKADEAKAAGADVVGAEDLVEKVSKGEIGFDRYQRVRAPGGFGLAGRTGPAGGAVGGGCGPGGRGWRFGRGAPIEVAELHAPFSHQELLLREALGLGEDVAVNPSGGALCGNPMFAAGLARIGLAARAVMSGRAGRALGHATSGPALQQNLVCVLSGEAS